ncbi:MAG TPA: hypothetical protein PKA63_02250 [Oligoflexia bacterium]|nr:hypothetical protein [Oligoflexia bacterium]HMP47473.1 hypothetical protein [Oligoflexia bacterium]
MSLNQMQDRRRRKRKPTSNGRFNSSQLAYELGLVRMALQVEREFLSEHNRKNMDKREK